MSNSFDAAHRDGRNGGASGHLCRHPGCGRWGAWGYDGGSGISAWWCIAHRPDTEPARPAVDESNWVSDGNEG
jgi:hypothetical protein